MTYNKEKKKDDKVLTADVTSHVEKMDYQYGESSVQDDNIIWYSTMRIMVEDQKTKLREWKWGTLSYQDATKLMIALLKEIQDKGFPSAKISVMGFRHTYPVLEVIDRLRNSDLINIKKEKIGRLRRVLSFEAPNKKYDSEKDISEDNPDTLFFDKRIHGLQIELFFDKYVAPT